MSRTKRSLRGKSYSDKDNPFKSKDKDKKFFGYPDDNWARLQGPNGKKRSYGHFAGSAADYPKHIRKQKKNPPPQIDEI